MMQRLFAAPIEGYVPTALHAVGPHIITCAVGHTEDLLMIALEDIRTRYSGPKKPTPAITSEDGYDTLPKFLAAVASRLPADRVAIMFEFGTVVVIPRDAPVDPWIMHRFGIPAHRFPHLEALHEQLVYNMQQWEGNAMSESIRQLASAALVHLRDKCHYPMPGLPTSTLNVQAAFKKQDEDVYVGAVQSVVMDDSMCSLVACVKGPTGWTNGQAFTMGSVAKEMIRCDYMQPRVVMICDNTGILYSKATV